MKSEYHNINVFEVDKVFIDTKIPVIHSDKNGFLLCRQGEITLSLDENVFNVKAGDLYIYPPFSQTYIKYVSDDIQGVVGIADFDFVLSSISPISSTRHHVYIRNRPCVTLSEEQYRRIEEFISLIKKRLDDESMPFRAEIISLLTKTLCYEMMGAYMSSNNIQPSPQNRKDRTFERFMADINSNLSRHRDVKFYAGIQCLTPRYFATVIRETSGKSPMEWITFFVTEEAKKLLSDPNLSIKEIAETLNFPSQSFFGRYFKQAVGVSPAKYRRG